MEAPGDLEGPRAPGGDDPAGSAGETPGWLSREQVFVLISAASVNLGSMMCYSILGPFFPKEAEKKGASNTIIGMIFGFQFTSWICGTSIPGYGTVLCHLFTTIWSPK
ncbi:SLC18B1 isoform 2 [Pongo abelii]|uniref:SLC18B1 isoform 2 n=1 Tax=Pongo abelii TaxID=9601 RepID=A0A2J8X988_PONAB|nr:SLC18B1 isoform 2 [Pongo abelii]